MRILLVHNRYKQYGGEDATFEAERRILEDRGHVVEALVYDNAEIAGLTAKLQLGYKLFYNVDSASCMDKIIEEFRPEIIHVHNYFYLASPSIFFSANKNKIPVIVTIQNYRLICSGSLLLRDFKICETCVNETFPLTGIRYGCHHDSVLETAHLTAVTGIHKLLGTWRNRISRYIAVTDFGRNKLIDSSLKLDPAKVVVKANSVQDVEPAEYSSREDYFLFVGRLSKEKGIRVLLDAFINTNIKVEIIGDGPMRAEVEDAVAANINIGYWGYQPREFIISRLRKSRGLLFPSIWYECLPVTILEAFSTGTPVIISNVGNLNEIVTHNQNGLLFKVNDPQDLYMTVRNFSERNLEYQTLYSDARRTYLEKYTPDVNYAALIKIYKEVVGQNIR